MTSGVTDQVVDIFSVLLLLENVSEVIFTVQNLTQFVE